MNLAQLLDQIRDLPEYASLLTTLEQGRKPGGPLGIPRAVRAPLAAALAKDLDRPVLFIVPRADRMLTLSEELPFWHPGISLHTFPEPNPLFYEKAAWGPRTVRDRIRALAILSELRQPGRGSEPTKPAPELTLAPTKAIMTRTLSPRRFISQSRWLRKGRSFPFEKLLKILLDTGYSPFSLVTEPGQFGRRGGILDLWPPAETRPIRLEFFGDEIESMREFDPSTQRSLQPLENLRITPAREALPLDYQDAWDALQPPSETFQPRPLLEYFLPWMNPSPTGMLAFMPENAIILLDDGFALEQQVSELEEQSIAIRQDLEERGELPRDAPLPYLTWPDIAETLSIRQTIDLGYHSGELDPAFNLADHFIPSPRFGGHLKPLMDFLAQRRRLHESVVVVSRQATRLAELSQREDIPRAVIDTIPDELISGDLHFLQGALSEGWTLQTANQSRLHLLSDSEIFGWARPTPRPRPRLKAKAPESQYADLKAGDTVVHVDYGIGRFEGLVERTISNLPREYLLVAFSGGDQVYVPIHQADRLTRYLGADGSEPNLSRLGTKEWERAKQRVSEAIEEVARDLLDLYAKRMTVRGHAFSPDGPWQKELEASFPYSETADQLHALQAVKQDMQLARPMDRLICGDVGYGKTEVALRAAFKAVLDGKQVAMLVPTTVLAQQHFNTFRQRLSAFPVEVEMLSRFRSRSESENILTRLALGEIDIIIGTHRLLQQDVRFHDIGLLIIDEEQRFGVTHKEFLKQKRTEIDVLTMTATPIPRTLYMALTGARDISTINTPPEERLPVITHIGPYDPRLIRQAVLRELDRGGQVFFVHNRVQTIKAVKRRLERLVPEARIAIGHGQMHEGQLAKVMEAFSMGELDVLVSTSIIESGLDIPNANTLIVDRADQFGLAQLYQLRGRVGRAAARGYAYFFRHPDHHATDIALQRLEVIAEHTQLGSGYSIAMRDLELRGAGDILGTRQHGHIATVGFHLYTRLLGAAVRRQRGRHEPATLASSPLPDATMPLAVAIDLPLASAIPQEYVQDRQLRLQLYRRMAEIRAEETLASLASELEDRFGPIPEQVENLLFQLRVRILASQADVDSITLENRQLLIQLSAQRDRDELPYLGPMVRVSRRGCWYPIMNDPAWQENLLKILRLLKVD